MKMPTDRNDFLENFRICCGESCTRLALAQCQNNPEYQAAQARRDQLFHKLARAGSWQLVDEYDSLRNQLFGMEEAYIYQQGFRDCIALLGWLGYPALLAGNPPQDSPAW